MKPITSVFNVTVAIVTLLLAGCEPPCFNVALSGIWQQDFEFGTGEFVFQHSDGGYVIGGHGVGGDVHGYGPRYLLKTDADGRQIWATYFTSGTIGPLAVVEAGDGSLVAAGSTWDAERGDWRSSVARLDSDGEVLWSQSFEESGLIGFSFDYVAATSDGNFVTVSNEGYAGSNHRAHAVKFDLEGNTVWIIPIDSAQSNRLQGLVPTVDGGVVLMSSRFLRRLEEDGTERWNVELSGDSGDVRRLVPSDDDGVVILRKDTLTRYDELGEVRWSKVFASMHGKEPSAFSADTDGGFVVGSSTLSYDAYPFYFPRSTWYCKNMVLTKLDGNGDIIWEREYSTDGIDYLSAVAPTWDGDYMVLGFTGRGFFSAYNYLFMLKVDGEG